MNDIPTRSGKPIKRFDHVEKMLLILSFGVVRWGWNGVIDLLDPASETTRGECVIDLGRVSQRVMDDPYVISGQPEHTLAGDPLEHLSDLSFLKQIPHHPFFS